MAGTFYHCPSMRSVHGWMHYKVIMGVKHWLIDRGRRLMEHDWRLMVDNCRSVNNY